MTQITTALFIIVGYCLLVMFAAFIAHMIVGIAKRLFRSNKPSVITGDKVDACDLYDHLDINRRTL